MNIANLPLWKWVSRTAFDRTLARVVYAALLFGVLPSVLQAKTVLLVIDRTSIEATESALKSQFESWGYTVTTIQDGATQGSFDASVAASDVVYVPGSVDDHQVLYKLRLATIGVVTAKAWLDVEFGYATSDGYPQSGTQILNVDNSHQVTSELSSGTVTIYNSSNSVADNGSTLAAGMQLLGERSSGHLGLGVIETGGALANTYSGNSTAAGRRVRLPWAGAFDISVLNSSGLSILENSLDWASGGSETLIAHWKFDEGTGTTLADATGNGNDASFNTGTPAWVSGIRYGALEFSGSNDAATDGSFNPPGTSTVAFWFRGAGIPAALQRLFGITTSWEVTFKPDGALGFDLGSGVTFSSDVVFDASDRWHHIVAITNASADTYSLYVDGKFVKSGSHSISDEPAGTLSFGTRTGMTDRFDGAIDDLRIYNYELTEPEIAEVYGLIGHWAFDEGSSSQVADSSLKGNDAQFNVGSPTWIDGIYGKALEFDGTNDAQTDAHFAPPERGSVSLWFRSAGGAPASRECVFGVGSDFEICQDNTGLISFDLSVDGLLGGLTTTTPLTTANRWYHLVAQYDSATDSYEIYINGELHKSGVSSSDIQKQTENFLSFGTRTGSTQRFTGAIDEFRIYNRWLSVAEINDLYGRIAFWKLDETSGLVATDSTEHEHHGAYRGAPALGETGAYGATTGTSVELDGTTQDVATDKPLLDNLSAFSMLGWVHNDDSQHIQGFFGQNDLIELGIHYSSGQLHFWTDFGGEVNTYNALPNGKWTHIAATGSGSELKIYLNGVEDVSGGHAPGSTYGTSNYNFMMGSSVSNPTGDYLGGKLDEVQIFDRAVTPEEIRAIYKNGRPAGVRIRKWVEVR